MKILDLDNPIFVVYVAVYGLGASRAQEQVKKVAEYFNYSNATFWTIPLNLGPENTRIELIWKGKTYSDILSIDEENDRAKSILKINNRLSKILELLSEGTSDENLKQKIRELSIDDIINE